MKYSAGFVLFASIFSCYVHLRAQDQPITVFVAKKIVAMDLTYPEATAVAVRSGKVLAVGSRENLQPWLKENKNTVNKQFKDEVLLPGLIDPHMHPMLGALQFGAKWITPEAWDVMG